jgi:hypothetical protein
MKHMPKVIIRPIEAENHRYATVGDWLYDAESDTLEVRVSRMADYRSEMAVAIHEFFEAVECLNKDISETDVTAFDLKYEDERADGKHSDTDEPGDDPRAPYRTQHIGATWVEREVCGQSGLDWAIHEKNVYDAAELQG